MKLLRLAGAPGVGKSTTAWEVAQRLVADGAPTGYVDIDQLGMCYPESADDPGRWMLKERALDAVAAEFRAAGVEHLVVSGVAWPHAAPPRPEAAAVRSIWLDAAEQTRRRRLAPRRLDEAELTRVLAAGTAEAARVHTAWERLATDDDTERQTVDRVMSLWRMPHPAAPHIPDPEALTPDALTPEPTTPEALTPEALAPEAPTPEPAPTPAPVLWITGARLAGASRVGWELVQRHWRAGRTAGFADLAQLSFAWHVHRPVGLPALARLHATFGAVGASPLVVVAPLEVDPAQVRAALPASAVSFVRLAPDADGIRAHAGFRTRGEGPVLAGDDLCGASAAHVDGVLRLSAAQSARPARPTEIVVPTAGLSPAAAADAVAGAVTGGA
ncbi:hypothetical protein N3K63_02605 [Microbacterium sp. W1N]|uniref:AAA family ATPase n=1 Tax=Microbacterium festucae TaxID=2977531 RepID=UPI0021C0E801|nr:AAA family ATPase [Microbacterium festucae]MCT9819173.1 hypothetical protein [Microbacterium festucae]